MKLNGKVALITGATHGFGLGLAQAFAREGAKVVINGRSQERVDAAVKQVAARGGETRGGETLGVVADVSSSESVRRMFADIVARFGTLDILVNNAALTPSGPDSVRPRMLAMALATTPIDKYSLGVTKNMSDESWDAMISVNLTGAFYCMREALKIMEEKRYGKIVNIASTAGISGLSSHSPHYSAAKGGLVALTRSVAVEVIGAGVNVNCIAAGAIATEAWAEAFAKFGEGIRKQILQVIPAGRLGTIEEFASLAVYLASDEAAYLVGQTISPNGGIVT